MEDSFEDAKDELKRVDHLIYVSLKYTRTCDVFKNIIGRIINSIDFMIEALLIDLLKQNQITEIPTPPGLRCNLVKDHIKDEKVIEMIDFYLLLRQLNRAKFTRAREYRRHVTMTCDVEGKDIEVNIDIITEYYKKTKDYIEYIVNLYQGEQS